MAGQNTMITLRSSDEVDFVVSKAVAMKSQIVRYVIEDDCAQNVIPLYNVDSDILKKVIEYCTMHVSMSERVAEASEAQKAEERQRLNAQFLNNVDTDTLYHLIHAANYLDIQDLLDLLCQKTADMMKGRSPEEIRVIFDVESDFTPEEEEEIRRENKWALEKKRFIQ